MRIDRRSLLIGGGVAGGLVIGWALWPRRFPPNLPVNEGETLFNAWLKIGRDGHVAVAVPEIEMGQGSYTLIPQLVADELGADWRTIAVEPAPINPVYADPLFSRYWSSAAPGARPDQVSDGSATVAAHEEASRRAGAAARILLCMAAAARWDADWRACDTDAGFVVRGDDRLSFAELAGEAARRDPPADIPLRAGQGRYTGRGMNRLDLPAKIDGSAIYAADVRLPDLVFAAIRQGPIGESRLIGVSRDAAMAITGVLEIVERERWVAAIASNWWAANRALDALKPRFATPRPLVDSALVATRLDKALAAPGERMIEQGEVAALDAPAGQVVGDYRVGLAPHVPLEPPCATAVLRDGRLELWLAAQLPAHARRAAADAAGLQESQVILYPVLAGGSFGQKFETAVAAQAATLAIALKRPVQLLWSRAEDLMQDRFRPAARARLQATLSPGGRIAGWRTGIAVPDALGETRRRVAGAAGFAGALAGLDGARADPRIEGAIPPYAVGAIAVDLHPADIGVPTGKWRSDAHSYTAFFTESFVDELAARSGIEPFSFRMALLGANPRLALCLSKAATKGGWEGGGPGTGQGLACHSMGDSCIAILAEAGVTEAGRVRVTKLVAVADVGRVLNPDIARQQIEGGLVFGMGMATGAPVTIEGGVAGPRRLGDHRLPLLADLPEMSVELVVSRERPGRVGEIGVPAVAPAIANALFAATGRRFRSLPLIAEAA